jgi:hypothetical protein
MIALAWMCLSGVSGWVCVFVVSDRCAWRERAGCCCALLIGFVLVGGVVRWWVVCGGQVFKGAWWMPWHQEPMKDVGACVKPRGVGNRMLIRGCPNGGTRPSSWAVTRT